MAAEPVKSVLSNTFPCFFCGIFFPVEVFGVFFLGIIICTAVPKTTNATVTLTVADSETQRIISWDLTAQ